ncbi:retinol dehydrogenase 7-like [Lineus longissimus]|uniref:retinol dehydrogenase 7-like n=1 Tax=Lineus longissimus TaxID=88925 RepID=UPI002B4E1868
MFFVLLPCLAITGYYIINWLIHHPKIDQYTKRYVLITGCDTGFGNLLAKRLDGLGFHIFAGCLTKAGEQELDYSTSDNLKTLALDVAKLESIQNAYDFVLANIPNDCGLWGLVNNAGMSCPLGPAEWLRVEQYQEVLSVNLFGMVEMTRVFFPLLKKAGVARIVNMSSTLGLLSISGIGPYCISKHGVEAYSDCLRRQLYKTNIKVSMIEPSGFRTNIVDKENESLRGSYSTEPEMTAGAAGTSYINKEVMNEMHSRISPNLSLVVDAYEHALTAKVPKSRYLVGDLSNDVYFVKLFAFVVPTWIADAILPCPFYTSK